MDWRRRRPLVPGSTATEIGLPIDAEAYTHSYIWVPSVKRISSGRSQKQSHASQTE